jgi:hypothetical protein
MTAAMLDDCAPRWIPCCHALAYCERKFTSLQGGDFMLWRTQLNPLPMRDAHEQSPAEPSIGGRRREGK